MREPCFDALLHRAEREPINVDISDYGDEWCAGFLVGQHSLLEELAAGRVHGVELRAASSQERP